MLNLKKKLLDTVGLSEIFVKPVIQALPVISQWAKQA